MAAVVDELEHGAARDDDGPPSGPFQARAKARASHARHPTRPAVATVRIRRRCGALCHQGSAGPSRGIRLAMLGFYSNRLGCGGSLLVSLIGTLLLLLLLGVVDL